MNWYYVDAGQQAGPVDDAQLEGLSRVGKIRPDTLVWHQGMSEWQPYQQAMPIAAGAAHAASSEPAIAGGVAPAPNQAICAECGRVFDKQEMVPHGNLHVCAACKPIMVQKLAEGVPLGTGTLHYAGFWLRFAAIFLDWIVLFVFDVALNLLAGLSFSQSVGLGQPGAVFGPLQLALFFIEMVVGISYETVLVGKYGATLGKFACGIKVVTPDGGRVYYGRAFGRYFAKLLSSLICVIGYIMAAMDDEKRALHDRICNTRVVFRE